MVTKPFIPSGAAARGASLDPWSWLDLGNAQARSWLELQRALWQPWWDAQSQWLQFWQTWWPVPMVRGTEQLA